jgi:hypothetical protein
MHDEGLAATECAMNESAHCMSSWCYVDEGCVGADGVIPTASNVIPGNFYSYANCGDVDTFADDMTDDMTGDVITGTITTPADGMTGDMAGDMPVDGMTGDMPADVPVDGMTGDMPVDGMTGDMPVDVPVDGMTGDMPVDGMTGEMPADTTGDMAGDVPDASEGLDSEILLPGSACECVPANELSFVHEGMNLPMGYGFGGCGPHDSMVPAFGCANNEEEFCQKSWCYVSAECTREDVADL